MQRKSRMQVSGAERAHILELLDSGLILQTEAARLLGVARQLIHQWCRAEHIEPVVRRRKYLRELMRDR